MLKGLHTDRRTAKTKLVDLLNGIATIKLTIDGTAGIFPGDAFTSKHLPNHLIRKGIGGALPLLFQATNIEHALGPDGWKTTITGQPRLNSRYLYEDEEVDEQIDPDEAAPNQKLDYFKKTRNILGINAHFMAKYKMYHGILRIHKSDPYWGGGDMTTDWSTEFPLIDGDKLYHKNDEPDFDTTELYTDGKKAVSGKKESYYMAKYSGISVQKAMWFSMYNAILYGIPPENTYQKRTDPYVSLDGTFNLMSYLMFVSDDINPTKLTKRYIVASKFGKLTYHQDFEKRIIKHFGGHTKLNHQAGGYSINRNDYYSPLQWITKETLKKKGLDEEYQQLFEFARILPYNKTYDPPDKLWNMQDITCVMRLTKTGRDIYKAFFKMLSKAWIGDDFEENVSLTANNKNIDESKIRDEYGKMFRNSGAGGYDQAVDDPTTESIDESELFKGSNIHTFNFDQEVDKFLDMMTKHGIIIAPLVTMRNSTKQALDYNAWDVINDTVYPGLGGRKRPIQKGLGAGNNLDTTDTNMQYYSVSDKEMKQIKLKTIT